MTYNEDLANSARRVELRQQVFLLRFEGNSFRDIVRTLKLSSTSVASRLLNEAFEDRKIPLPPEIRRSELANLEVWAERLEEAFELALNEGNTDSVAKLAQAAAKISESRRKILAVDTPATVNVKHGADDSLVPEPPQMAAWVKEYQESKLGKLDQEEAAQ